MVTRGDSLVSRLQILKGTDPPKLWRKKLSRYIKPHKHHLNLIHRDDSPENVITMPGYLHHKFHFAAYEYLLDKYGKEELLKYFEWFKEKYWKNFPEAACSERGYSKIKALPQNLGRPRKVKQISPTEFWSGLAEKVNKIK